MKLEVIKFIWKLNNDFFHFLRYLDILKIMKRYEGCNANFSYDLLSIDFSLLIRDERMEISFPK